MKKEIILLLVSVFWVFVLVSAQGNGLTTSVAVSSTVTEKVTCVFDDSDKEQSCYSDDSRFRCFGVETCTVELQGQSGDALTWKSSCGGYAYTTVDGNSEDAEFKCVSELEVTKDDIKDKGFSYAYWECYDGASDKQGGSDSCKSSEMWQKYAKDFCEGHCYDDGSKCGVNSFSVIKECYTDGSQGSSSTDSVQVATSVSTSSSGQGDGTSSETEGKKGELLICKDSCPLDGKCYPFGYRKNGDFCSDTGSFAIQLNGDIVCENNFECSSNVCVDSMCVSEGVFKKMLDWFGKLFGR